MGESESGTSLADHFLEEWSATRGPLFEDPREAVCRILAIETVAHLSRLAPGRTVRLRAARVLGEALVPVADSNRPAGKEQRARVNMALVDIKRAYRKAGHYRDITPVFEKLLHRAAFEKDLTGQLRTRALAEQLAAVLQGESSLLQLRAARTLLAMTRDAARKVGRERPDAAQQDASPKAPPAQEVVHEHEHVHVHDSGTHPTQQAYECRAASPP
ncbi:MAG: hypothetical protein KDH09_11685 [Chrysiogenetes bacterium]|nr:hypothetical protein [Chrysiogenetes bacterium]